MRWPEWGAVVGVSLSGVSPAHAFDFNWELYGYAQLDYIQDLERVDPKWEATLRPTRIPTEAGQYGSDGQAILSVRQSRFGVKFDWPVGEDAVHTVFEFDLFGVGVDAGQTTMRLRHAYGQWKWLLAGQANSLFMDGDMFPNIIDYWGPAGMVLYRNPQIRFTPVSGDHTLAVAVERPGTDVDPGRSGAQVQSKARLPDLTTHYRLSGEWGHLQGAGLFRDLGYESTTGGPSGHAFGAGFHVSSNLKFEGAVLRLSTIYGQGVANYMNDASVDLAPVDDTTWAAVPLLGVVGYLDVAWTEHWGSSLGYSFVQMSNTPGQTGSAFHRGDYASAVVSYEPIHDVFAGVSYLWGRRSDFDGAVGTDNRVQVSFKYSFSTADLR